MSRMSFSIARRQMVFRSEWVRLFRDGVLQALQSPRGSAKAYQLEARSWSVSHRDGIHFPLEIDPMVRINKLASWRNRW